MESVNQLDLKRLSLALDAVRRRQSAADPHGKVRLLAVSKTFALEHVLALASLGQTAFAENYVQEGCAKVDAAKQSGTKLEWHFIGPLQSNKTRIVAERFDWVQTVDRLKIAQRLNEQRPIELAKLEVLIQVNVSEEQSKSGCLIDEVPALAKEILALPRLRLRGLMAIPEIGAPKEQYQNLKRSLEQLQRTFPDALLDTLSIGMSGDLELAIESGSTMIRVGSAIFGNRV